MTHEELLQAINNRLNECTTHDFAPANFAIALRKIVELHKPVEKTWPSNGEPRITCGECEDGFAIYPCPTIQAIDKELK